MTLVDKKVDGFQNEADIMKRETKTSNKNIESWKAHVENTVGSKIIEIEAGMKQMNTSTTFGPVTTVFGGPKDAS